MYKENIALRIKTLRIALKLTQPKLGSFVGLSKQAINDIESGRRSTTAEKLALIADYFDVSVDYLLGRTDNPKVNK